MTYISEKFTRIAKSINLNSVQTNDYWGIYIYAYRKKRKISIKQMSNQLGLDEIGLMRIECGYGSKEEIEFILSKIQTDKK